MPLIACTPLTAGTGELDTDGDHSQGDGDGDQAGDGDGDSPGDGDQPGDGDAPGDGDSEPPAGDGDGDAGDGDGEPLDPQAIRSLAAGCQQVSHGMFAHDLGGTDQVPICGLSGALFWKADLDVNCDGQESAQCNRNTDPWWQNQTAGTTSRNEWLDAATLPFVVIPQPNERFDYASEGLDIGTVVAVLYGDRLAFGVFGDQGPADIIGEASYAMAELLGIDPDPATGGTSDEVLYIAFQGQAGQSWPLEDHAAATAHGRELLGALLAGP